MTIKVAATGVGHWHSLYDAKYLNIFDDIPDVEFVGIQDTKMAVAEHRSAAIGKGTAVFTDYRKMIDETKPDFVLALGRHDEMADTARYLVENDIPFMMEKPMGLNSDQVGEVAELAVARNSFAAVPFTQRYLPWTQQARELLKKGDLGTVSHLYFRNNRPTSDRYLAWDSEWMFDPALGGGCLRNLGIHGIDLFLHLTGEDVEVIGAQSSNRVHGRAVEDYVTVMVRTPSGILGTIESGNTFPQDGTDGEWKISGSKVLLAAKDGKIRRVTTDADDTSEGAPHQHLSITAVQEILAAWRAGQKPPASVVDCYRANKVVDAAFDLIKSR
jgi:predicted dehydrogenase